MMSWQSLVSYFVIVAAIWSLPISQFLLAMAAVCWHSYCSWIDGRNMEQKRINDLVTARLVDKQED